MKQLTTLLILVGVIGPSIAKRFGNHDFPKKPSLTGVRVDFANEFELINPHNIEKGKLFASNAYSIDSVSPTVIGNDEVVTVSYHSSTPLSTDWIGAYSPADIDITTVVPVKYGYCDEAGDYLTAGKGALTFNLTNLRADVAFYYFTTSLSKPVLVATASQKVTFKNNNEPLRPRVVPTGDYDVFNLLWSSATSTTPVLRWGTSSGVYDYTANAVTSHIDQGEMCGAPASTYGWRDLGLIHTAPFQGMKALAGKDLYYTFGDAKTDDFSKEYVFHVPPLPGSQGVRPTTAILFDDLGRGSSDMTYTWYEYGRPAFSTISAVGAEVARGEVDVVYHGGDISYAVGYLGVWDFYADMMAPVTSGTLYLTTVGNHESDWYSSASAFNNSDSGGECGVVTTRLYPMPSPAQTNTPWWSYEVGLMHFIGISTEHSFVIGSDQYKWLEADLKSIDRTVTPWVIFGGHRAMYLNSNYGGGTTSDIALMDQLIANVEPLLWKYRVNLGFYGHNHVVQRQSAVYNRTVVQASTEVIDSAGQVIHFHADPQATVHMVVGTGGAAFTVNAVEPKPVWNEMYMYQYGYARVTAVNASYLDWQWVLSSTGQVLDHMVITQSDPTKPWVI
jgi:hypothetical protein